jgi:hypothetical protein
LESDAESAPLREALTAERLDVFEVTTMTASSATAVVEEP